MFAFQTALLSLVATAFLLVGAADNSDPTAAALTAFQKEQLLTAPILTESTKLEATLTLSFGKTKIELGQKFTLPTDDALLKQTPTWILDVDDKHKPDFAKMKYTAGIFDKGSSDHPIANSESVRHYLENGLKYNDDGMLQSVKKAITSYAEPGPAEGSGAHRYIALVFEQGDKFKAPDYLNNPGTGVSNMSIEGYIQKSNIGKIVAMTYFTVEQVSDAQPSEPRCRLACCA